MINQLQTETIIKKRATQSDDGEASRKALGNGGGHPAREGAQAAISSPLEPIHPPLPNAYTLAGCCLPALPTTRVPGADISTTWNSMHGQ